MLRVVICIHATRRDDGVASTRAHGDEGGWRSPAVTLHVAGAVQHALVSPDRLLVRMGVG